MNALNYLFNVMMLFILGHAEETFQVQFQSSGKWSETQWVEYVGGKIPQLEEVTACHWEKMIYLGMTSSNIWSYCNVPKTDHHIMRCIQLFSTGNQSFANQQVVYGAWFAGWTDDNFGIQFPLASTLHRTWNHICWTYSKLTRKSRLYYNGKVETEIPLNNQFPVLERDDTAFEYAFTIGQEPDSWKGSYQSEQAFYGSIAELNLCTAELNFCTAELNFCTAELNY